MSTSVAGDGWDRAAPAALMIRRCAPVRRWSDAVRPVMPTDID
ncbi:hypothetical protein [Vineibacter terrae]|nr:hypothetical protein [Vineibacter terrae]